MVRLADGEFVAHDVYNFCLQGIKKSLFTKQEALMYLNAYSKVNKQFFNIHNYVVQKAIQENKTIPESYASVFDRLNALSVEIFSKEVFCISMEELLIVCNKYLVEIETTESEEVYHKTLLYIPKQFYAIQQHKTVINII